MKKYMQYGVILFSVSLVFMGCEDLVGPLDSIDNITTKTLIPVDPPALPPATANNVDRLLEQVEGNKEASKNLVNEIAKAIEKASEEDKKKLQQVATAAAVQATGVYDVVTGSAGELLETLTGDEGGEFALNDAADLLQGLLNVPNTAELADSLATIYGVPTETNGDITGLSLDGNGLEADQDLKNTIQAIADSGTSPDDLALAGLALVLGGAGDTIPPNVKDNPDDLMAYLQDTTENGFAASLANDDKPNLTPEMQMGLLLLAASTQSDEEGLIAGPIADALKGIPGFSGFFGNNE
ncbi:MAG: hypothetical protein LBQ77_04920 [Treponema sp.]|nr:hypothetical protein [Treponema sp.]